MLGICSKCGNLAELHGGLCCICKMEKEIDNSKGVKVEKIAEASVKTFRKMTGLHKESSAVVKEEGEE